MAVEDTDKANPALVFDPVKCHRSPLLAARLIFEHDRAVTDIPGKMDALRVACRR